MTDDDNAPYAVDVTELARVHARALESYALSLCGNAHDAQDLVQATFERLLMQPRARLPRRNQRAWLFTVLRHLFLDAHRRATSAPRRVELDLTTLASVGDEDEPPPPRWQELTAREVRAALELLDEDFAAAFCLHELEGRSYADIASILGVSVNTVGTRILRARRKLRVVLSERLP